jgi:hypothetical protein
VLDATGGGVADVPIEISPPIDLVTTKHDIVPNRSIRCRRSHLLFKNELHAVHDTEGFKPLEIPSVQIAARQLEAMRVMLAVIPSNVE